MEEPSGRTLPDLAYLSSLRRREARDAHGHAFVEGVRFLIRAVDFRRPVVVMIGCERQGLSPLQEDLCDKLVRIPMAARVDSLNVAAATAVLLYEVFGQRHPAGVR